MAAKQKKSSSEELRIVPQPTQQSFLSSVADIAVYGGAAGSGKSWSLLIEPLRNLKNAKFGGVIFRRTFSEVKMHGGLWDESMSLYPLLGGHPRENSLEWIFPRGMKLKFGHLQYDYDVYNYQGSSIPYIGFDELTSFTEKQFWFLLSRNRSMSGVPAYIRAGCNPDADSWVKTLIRWYIDDEGDPIPSRSGKLRWFIRLDDQIHWANSEEELITQFGEDAMPKSFTFISATIYDNTALLQKDPGYLANLKALSRVDRLRLLGGNWNVRATAGSLFRKEWFPVVDVLPAGHTGAIRFWDRAATKPNEVNKDPDWTVGVKLYRYPDNTYAIVDVIRFRDTPLQVRRFLKNTADLDTRDCIVGVAQDPGQAGVVEAQDYVRMLSGFDVRLYKEEKDKVTRAKPLSAQVEAGNIKVLKARWNEDFFSELENFGEDMTGHDDQVDAASGAFTLLTQAPNLFDFFR